MQLTIEKHTSKRDEKKGLDAIIEESKYDEEFDSDEMM